MNIERQIRNILAKYPDAKIIQEVFTRTSFVGRKEWDKLMRVVKKGDKIAESATGLSLPQYASISGRVAVYDNTKIIIEKVNE